MRGEEVRTHQHTAEPEVARGRFHPLSGALCLLVDNVFWGVTAISVGTTVAASSLMAFVLTGVGVYLIQRNLARDRKGPALARAFFLAVIAGLPTSLAGTAVGALVMAWAGMRGFGRK